MLHVDPTSYDEAQSSKNPLFLGVLPPKDRFPEKYIAIISGVPLTLHPGASVLAVGKQSPPILAIYWEKKLQFSLQVKAYFNFFVMGGKTGVKRTGLNKNMKE